MSDKVESFTVYGYQVCPYLETLTLPQLLAPAVIALGTQFLFASIYTKHISKLPIEQAVSKLFRADLLICVCGGIFVATYNFVAFDFPFDSGIKAFFAFLAAGYYLSLDLAFEREIRLSTQLRNQGKNFPTNSQFMPFRTKFLMFSMMNIFIISSIMVLVVLKDLIWFSGTALDPMRAQMIIAMELLFILAVLSAYIFRTIKQYSKKTDINLQEESNILRAVQSGDLTKRATITSNDEFGHIAGLTNETIEKLKNALEDVEQTRSVTINALVQLSAKRDNETAQHLIRTQLYAKELATEISKLPKFSDIVTPEFISLIYQSAPLHDVGKVGIPDAILTKPGPLTDAEFDVMKTHVTIGAEALEEADASLGGTSFLSTAKDIAASHHEKWDGSGYPRGLSGSDIPLASRIMAIADVYDALRSKRVYKPAMPHEKAASIILEGRGGHFDPNLVDAFERIEHRFEKIANQYSETKDKQIEGKPKAA